MEPKTRKRLTLAALAPTAAALMISAAPPAARTRQAEGTIWDGAGALNAIDRDGRPTMPCPLKHTGVKAEISGPLARVTVSQDFENTSGTKIEAVYTFPLPHKAAVDGMTMRIGDRTIKGRIRKREEARQIFEDARRRGHLASLLDQQRPNIFTQAVTNIEPGAKVRIEITYVEAVPYEAGHYTFTFPMVVGPRYIPGGGRVPDAGVITPPVAAKGVRAGHDIHVEVSVDAGVPIEGLASKTHAVDIERPSPERALVRLRNQNEIPNKDFLLSYDVAGRKIQDAVLAHRGGQGGFFALMLQPPERVDAATTTPKELVFVVDTSGSMSGFPIEKSKEVIKLALDGLYPQDTFNLITFAGDTHVLFPRPVPATPENVRRAQEFLLSRQGQGGTEMMKAIRAALDPSDQQDHVRIVCFMTDGYVGNDMEIIGEIRRHPNARIFSFGVGSSVNRFLLDKMAAEGRGEVEYVSLQDDGSAAARRFHERVRNPLLTDITVEWNGLPVSDVFPANHPDLFAAKPLVIVGRYNRPAKGTVRIRGAMRGRDFVKELAVTLPESENRHDVLATLWAREKIEDLMSRDWEGMQRGNPSGGLKAEITQLGLDFRLMTQFTSFVAVEETVVTRGGAPVRVEVPVEMPSGVSHEGVFGEAEAKVAARVQAGGSLALRATLGAMATTAPAPSRRDTTTAAPPRPVPPLPRQESAAPRLDPALASHLRGLDSGSPVKIKVWLSAEPGAVIGDLKRLGLVVRKQTGRILFAEAPAGAIERMALHGSVMWISLDPGSPAE